MGVFDFAKNQFQSSIRWDNPQDEVLLYRYPNREIKNNSNIIIRSGQSAVFMHNGKIEGIFSDEGDYDLQTKIIPFLTTLKSFKFGFNTPFIAEIIFCNTTEITCKWGTQNPILLRGNEQTPGGIPVKCFGTFSCKIVDTVEFIDRIAGVNNIYTIDNIRDRLLSNINQLLLNVISSSGVDILQLQSAVFEISSKLQKELDYDFRKIGIAITQFTVANFNYPQEVQAMIDKVAARSMVGDVDKYTKIAMADSFDKENGANVGSQMAQMMMGMQMGQNMVNNMQNSQQQNVSNIQNTGAKFCSNCGTPLTTGAKFCSNCGAKLI